MGKGIRGHEADRPRSQWSHCPSKTGENPSYKNDRFKPKGITDPAKQKIAQELKYDDFWRARGARLERQERDLKERERLLGWMKKYKAKNDVYGYNFWKSKLDEFKAGLNW